MKAIAAADLNWGIGYSGKLLQCIPEDMEFFKHMTLGKVVVMGRETFESLPGKEPLKDRINIVLSRNTEFRNEKITICHSLDELFQELGKYYPDDVFVIGGQWVYAQLLPYCKEAYVTRIEKAYAADRYFINLDREENWELVLEGALKSYDRILYKFVKYVNKRK